MGRREQGTASGPDSVRTYLDEISRHELLTRPEEERLGQAIESGRTASKELEEGDGRLAPERRRQLRAIIAECDRSTRQFIVSNLRLVVSIAKRYRNSGVPLPDLIQEGNIGLITAVRKFDYRRGFRFSTYATFWIRQAIGRAVANSGRAIRLPVHTGERLTAVKKARVRLESEMGREPSPTEIGAATGLTPGTVTDLLELEATTVSLNTPLGGDGGELGDLVEDEAAAWPFEAALSNMEASAVHQLLSGLGDRDREVLCLRFGLSGDKPLSLAEVGERIGLSGERVRQIERRAIAKLKPELACVEE